MNAIKDDISDLITRARELSYKNFGSGINFYQTSDYFPAVSVTGSSCALDCKHCKKKLINRLPSAKDPEALRDVCMSLHGKGAKGVLITGGCTADGKVPIYDFLDAIRQIKELTGMKIIAHTGIADYAEARRIKEAGIDGVCLDVVGSVETTKEIYNRVVSGEEYRQTLEAFSMAGIRNISPHICVGLHNGRLHHELDALEIISCIKPTNIVIIGLTGLEGTPMEGVKINTTDVIRILCLARLRFPESIVSLGCARAKGRVKEEIDRLAVRAGVNGIAIPTKAAYEEAARLGREVREFRACCALLPSELR